MKISCLTLPTWILHDLNLLSVYCMVVLHGVVVALVQVCMYHINISIIIITILYIIIILLKILLILLKNNNTIIIIYKCIPVLLSVQVHIVCQHIRAFVVQRYSANSPI